MLNVFLTSASKLEQCPQDSKPEVCFIGRSNVGKSSLINALAKSKIAKTSNTPGRTQTLNFYLINQIRVVDLPGYGYAKVSLQQRDFLSELISDYLHHRENLKVVFQVVDAGVITNQDQQIAQLIRRVGITHFVVANKVDKLKQSEKAHLSDKIIDYLHIDVKHFMIVSSLKKINLEILKKEMEFNLK